MSEGSAAYRVLRARATSLYVLVCDHASNHVPAQLHDLGLSASDLTRHIAWDIGAAGVTEALSELLDATAILSSVSRLVIDCNRQLASPSLIPDVSDGTAVPANHALPPDAREARIASWFRPYHDAVESVLLDRETRGLESVLVSIHSMTPSLAGAPRPWPIALSSHSDRRLTEPVLAGLRDRLDQPGADTVVGDNQPYSVDPDVDYTTPYHAMRRGLHHLQVEFRQDEVADAAGQRTWAGILAGVLIALKTSS
ncbi:MAG: N-formylglutamate amidohydrolase [Vicinamibacterales bacterium]